MNLNIIMLYEFVYRFVWFYSINKYVNGYEIIIDSCMSL